MKNKMTMKLHMTSGVASLAKKSKASFSGLGAQRSAIKLQKRLQYDNKRPKTSLLHWEFFKHGKVTTTIKVVNAENVRKMVIFVHLVHKLEISISKVMYLLPNEHKLCKIRTPVQRIRQLQHFGPKKCIRHKSRSTRPCE